MVLKQFEAQGVEELFVSVGKQFDSCPFLPALGMGG